MAKRLKAIPTPKEGFAIEVRKWSISAFPALWKDDLGAQNCGGGSNFYLPEVVRKVRFSGRQSVAKSSNPYAAMLEFMLSIETTTLSLLPNAL